MGFKISKKSGILIGIIVFLLLIFSSKMNTGIGIKVVKGKIVSLIDDNTECGCGCGGIVYEIDKGEDVVELRYDSKERYFEVGSSVILILQAKNRCRFNNVIKSIKLN